MMKKLLLVVEDNPLLIEMYQTAFEKEGYMVSLASNGETAITLAKELKPTNLLLDLFMPGVDGFEVIRALKSDNATKDINIVVLTSDTKSEDLERAKNLGASECLIKPELTLSQIVERAVLRFGTAL